MYYLNQDAKLSNLFLQASSPTTGTAPRSQSRLSVCPSTQDICRICHCEGDEESPLITPCRCTGTLRFVHQSCLHQWIKSSDTRCCELCKYDFIMETKLKPLRKWEKLQMTTSERRKIFCSVTFHVIAITCVVWSLYVLIDRTAEEIKQGNDNGVLEWPFWTKLVVVAIGFTGGLVFMYVQCKVYVQLWRRLKAYNRVIFVQNCPDTAKKQEKNFSCNVNTDIKDAVVVPVSQTGTNSLPSADGGPPEVIPVWRDQLRVSSLKSIFLALSHYTWQKWSWSIHSLYLLFLLRTHFYLLCSKAKDQNNTKWPGSHKAVHPECDTETWKVC